MILEGHTYVTISEKDQRFYLAGISPLSLRISQRPERLNVLAGILIHIRRRLGQGYIVAVDLGDLASQR